VNALTIARFTLQEAISRRLILAGAILSLAFLGLFVLGFALIYHNTSDLSGPMSDAQERAMFGTIMSVLGLYAVNFLAGFLALFLSVGAISSEIDSGALHAVLARPLRRAEFVAGRWLAYAGLIGGYVGLMAGSLLLAARLISGYSTPDPLRATLLMMLAAIVLLTVSLFGSTVLSTLANGVVVFSLFGLAWLAGIIEVIGSALSNEAMLNIGTAVSLLIPSDAIWRGASYYVLSPIYLAGVSASQDGIPFVGHTPPAMAMVVWALLYPLVLLAGAVLTFARRDL
jgi:ABC-type transport system involved in multi-copper enzyme maturation permease subunit